MAALNNGEPLSAKVPGADAPGEMIHVGIPASHIHVFDAETGLRLDPAAVAMAA